MTSAVSLLAVVGATATGKTALGVQLAEALDGEILSCDSTAVYRGVDIGTDKPTLEQRRGIPHHLIDVIDPTDRYSAARFADDAAAIARDVTARGRVPILVGGTGFYYTALKRGLFPAPSTDLPLRARLDRVAAARGVEALHRWLARVDPASARRILPRDQKRLVRALEVYLATGKAMTEHFGDTRSPLPEARWLTIGLSIPRDVLRLRVARRVEEQFARGVVSEVESLLASGVPAEAHVFTGLVYRQIMDMRAGLRDEQATRDLIVQQNMRYARRQEVWFRRDPDVHWLEAHAATVPVAESALALARTFVHASSSTHA